MNQSGNKILVVDDDREMASLLSDVLRGEGFSVVPLSESLEASRILRFRDH